MSIFLRWLQLWLWSGGQAEKYRCTPGRDIPLVAYELTTTNKRRKSTTIEVSICSDHDIAALSTSSERSCERVCNPFRFFGLTMPWLAVDEVPSEVAEASTPDYPTSLRVDGAFETVEMRYCGLYPYNQKFLRGVNLLHTK
jgi:hypothetical protein